MNGASKEFEKTIQEYLTALADRDELFKVTLAKPTKNIGDCCTYIINEVKKTGKAGFTDGEIFGMAVHYYDEDDIKIGEKTNAQVVVNHVVELSEEDKKEVKEKALERAIESRKQKLLAKPKKPEASKEFIQTSLF